MKFLNLSETCRELGVPQNGATALVLESEYGLVPAITRQTGERKMRFYAKDEVRKLKATIRAKQRAEKAEPVAEVQAQLPMPAVEVAMDSTAVIQTLSKQVDHLTERNNVLICQVAILEKQVSRLCDLWGAKEEAI